MTEVPDDATADAPVAAYKRVLQAILDQRPSGTRQRLAEALGKNRSFISQIANPAYATPIPAQYLDQIFEICHFSPQQRDLFLTAYRQAHPRRLRLLKDHERQRRLTLVLPDLGDDAKNHKLDELIADLAHRLVHLLQDH